MSVNQTDSGFTTTNTAIQYVGYDVGGLATGDRFADFQDGSTDYRGYQYDARRNVREVSGYRLDGATWRLYSDNSGFDARNRRAWKSRTTTISGGITVISSWLFYYDPLDRLTEIRYTPNTASPSTFTIFQLLWLGDRLTGYWQTDYPAVTTSKRYVATDETGRPMEMWSWPSSGNATQVWAINPSAWGFDTNVVGPAVFQPVLFAGQYQDVETAAFLANSTLHRPGLALNGFRTYDPFTGSYLQVDPIAPQSWNSYGYVDGNPVGRKDPLGLMYSLCTSYSEPGMLEVDGEYWPTEVIDIHCQDDGRGIGGQNPGDPDLGRPRKPPYGGWIGGFIRPTSGPSWDEYGEQRPGKRLHNAITCLAQKDALGDAWLDCVGAQYDGLAHDCVCLFGGEWHSMGELDNESCLMMVGTGGSTACENIQCHNFNIFETEYNEVCPGDCGPGYWHLCK